MTILPLTYLGSTEWFGRLAQGGCVIDIGENWVKQTARNHCEIMTCGGVAALRVPVHGRKAPTQDIRIDNSKRWQHQHWGALVAAYKNSPFFDHYEDRFAGIFGGRRFDLLCDLNFELLGIISSILRLEEPVEISENYVVAGEEDIDLRGKKALRREAVSATPATSTTSDPSTPPAPTLPTPPVCAPYTQVFSDRLPFISGLSIIDAIFCEGPEARKLIGL